MSILEKNIDVIIDEEEHEIDCVDTGTDYLKDSKISYLSNAFHNAGLIIDEEFDEAMIQLLYENSLKKFMESVVNDIKTDTFCVNIKHSLNKRKHIIERAKQIQSYVADCRITHIGYTTYYDIENDSEWHRYYVKTSDGVMRYSVRNASLLYFMNSIYNDIHNNKSE